MTGRGGTDYAFQNALTYTCDLAAAREITVLIEPINLRDVAGYHLSTTDRAESNIDAVGKPSLKLMFDAWHLQVMKGDLINSVTRLLPKIEHTQIAGGPDSGESDQGEVDYAFPLKNVADLGWYAPIGAEFKPLGSSTSELLGCLSDLQEVT